jgi:hypothetical protein
VVEKLDNARRRDRAAQAIGAYDDEVRRGARPPRLRSAPEATEAISELICDLRHLAEEFHLDWAELGHHADRYYREEAQRHVVEVTGEGFQIRDSETDRLRADMWGSRTDAEAACDSLNEEAFARAA